MDQQLEEVTVDIKKIAYKKSLLHSCKYATDDVLGRKKLIIKNRCVNRNFRLEKC